MSAAFGHALLCLQICSVSVEDMVSKDAEGCHPRRMSPCQPGYLQIPEGNARAKCKEHECKVSKKQIREAVRGGLNTIISFIKINPAYSHLWAYVYMKGATREDATLAEPQHKADQV